MGMDRDSGAMQPVLVIGGTGKTGRRVAAQLAAQGQAVRIGSRSGTPAFDWARPEGWAAVLDGVRAAYVTYPPDIMMPEAAGRIARLAEEAAKAGVSRLVLLSGRGEERARVAEDALVASDVDWTILRASWFQQNFSEEFLLDGVLAGTVALPAEPVGEPFIDAEDIAAVAVAALTENGHGGRIYELTGPRLLTFAEAVAAIAAAAGRPIGYVQVGMEDFIDALAREGVPEDYRWLMRELFSNVLDGRNASTTDDVERVLGRPPRDFADYVTATAATGVWRAAA
ncbi:MAG: NmrA family transcriptional regulator [Azospirillaceae bacterium]